MIKMRGLNYLVLTSSCEHVDKASGCLRAEIFLEELSFSERLCYVYGVSQ
jgi:hypothetical protein